MILLFAFTSYTSFSIIDITSFAVFTLAGCIIIIPAIYLPFLKYLGKKVSDGKQFFWFPVALILLANLPVYFIIWLKTNDLYGRSEAILFFLAFVTTALVFGLSWAWKCNIRRKSRSTR
jgi:hypothetical protein